jgi:hypothetical protein
VTLIVSGFAEPSLTFQTWNPSEPFTKALFSNPEDHAAFERPKELSQPNL